MSWFGDIMKKIEVAFSIKSLDSQVEFTTIGEIKSKRIKFVDPEKNTNYIVFHNDIIEYYKKGNVDLKYRFDTSMITKGLYKVSGFPFEFTIKTISIIDSPNELSIDYELFQDGELINETKLNIRYTVLKEE